MIPETSVEAAVEAFREAHEAAHKVWREQPGGTGGSLADNLRAALEAAAPYISAAAFAEGHESGFWNGRLSHGDPEALTGIEHEKTANPYRRTTK